MYKCVCLVYLVYTHLKNNISVVLCIFLITNNHGHGWQRPYERIRLYLHY